MSRRRAILVGVSRYDIERLNLEVARTDVDDLQEVLDASGYQVTPLVEDTETTRGSILAELRRACRSAERDETLLLYFSGHGVHWRNRDYLVPREARFDDPEELQDYLVDSDFSKAVAASSAASVILFIDACREGVEVVPDRLRRGESGTKSVRLRKWTEAELEDASNRRFLKVFACGPGQVAQHASGRSLFSQALAEALSPETTPTTLRAVLKYAQERLDKLVKGHGKRSQVIHIVGEDAAKASVLEREVCQGGRAATPHDACPDWVRLARETPLWGVVRREQQDLLDPFRNLVMAIVADCAAEFRSACSLLPADPWSDACYPSRVLGNLHLLVRADNAVDDLSVVEMAILIVTPFVRERILARSITHEHDINPLALSGTGTTKGLRAALERTHRRLPQHVRRAQALLDAGRKDEHDAIAYWLFHRCVLHEPSLWTTLADDARLRALLLESTAMHPWIAKNALSLPRLERMARCVAGGLEMADRTLGSDFLDAEAVSGEYNELRLNEKLVGILLTLVGEMSVDVRTLSSVIVDHVGLSQPLSIPEVVATIGRLRWSPTGRAKKLTGACSHPAVDYAVREHVSLVARVLARLHASIEKQQHGLSRLQTIPTRVTADGLEPEKQEGIEAYELPHVRFELEQDRVQELLMGERLYGESAVAIRELYQNAVDATRYRRGRSEYLQRTRREAVKVVEWEPRVVLRQGTQGGRPYIECEDNGIGMGRREIERCFARAGQRFCELPEFVEESIDWARLDPPIVVHANSQFGVGVFSYFMLADELEVDTCRLSRDGEPTERFRVSVAGKSSLFRIQHLGPGSEAGTRVRLYMSKLVSLDMPAVMRQVVWVPEVRTEIHLAADNKAHIDAVDETWEPHRLTQRPAGSRDPDTDTPREQAVSAGHIDLWFTKAGEGRILSDGLVTEEKHPILIVNLRGDRLPNLTLDRRRILNADTSWVDQALLERECPDILGWGGLDFGWLAELGVHFPRLADRIIRRDLPSVRTTLVIKTSDFRAEVPVTRIGALKNDLDLIEDCARVNRRLGRLAEALQEGDVRAEVIDKLLTRRDWSDDEILSEFLGRRDSMGRSAQRLHRVGLKVIKAELSGVWEAADQLIGRLPPNLLAPRLKVWEELGLRVPRPIWEILDGNVDAVEACLTPLDAALLSERFDGTGPWLQAPSLGHAVAGAHRLQITVGTALERLARLCGLQLPPGTDTATLDFVPSELDQRLFHQVSTGRVELIDVLASAVRAGQSIEDVIARFARFAPLGVGLPPDVAAVSQPPLDRADLLILSKDLDGESPWVEGPMSAWQQVLAAERLGLSIRQLRDRAAALASLGLKLRAVPDDCLDWVPGAKDLCAASSDADGRPPWLAGRVGGLHALRVAAANGEPLKAALARLRRLPCFLEIELPSVELPDGEPAASQGDLSLLSKRLDGEAPWIESPVPVSHMVAAAAFRRATIGEIRMRFAPVSKLGFELPTVALAVNDWTPGRADVILLSEGINGIFPYVEEVTATQVLRVAVELETTLADLCGSLSRLRDLGMAVPAVGTDLGWHPRKSDLRLLSVYLDDHAPWLENEVAAGHVFLISRVLGFPVGEALDRLRRYAEAGMVLPNMPSGCEARDATHADLLLLSKNLDAQWPWLGASASVSHVLRAGLRLGLSRGEVVERLTDICGEAIELPAASDERWAAGERRSFVDLLRYLPDDSLSVAVVLDQAAKSGASIGAVLASLRPLEQVGFSLPAIDSELSTHVPSERATFLVRKFVAIRHKNEAEKSRRFAEISKSVGLDPVDAWHELRRFQQLGLDLPLDPGLTSLVRRELS